MARKGKGGSPWKEPRREAGRTQAAALVKRKWEERALRKTNLAVCMNKGEGEEGFSSSKEEGGGAKAEQGHARRRATRVRARPGEEECRRITGRTGRLENAKRGRREREEPSSISFLEGRGKGFFRWGGSEISCSTLGAVGKMGEKEGGVPLYPLIKERSEKDIRIFEPVEESCN